MCVDFTDLTKACPKDSFLCPRIDMSINCTTSHRMLSFMDAYSRGHPLRLVNQMFKDQIGRNMEVYVDDLLVKSGTLDQHLDDLREVFTVLRRYQMKVNLAKSSPRPLEEDPTIA
ncbi:uncharacterized protein LOC122310235 [Carya illinoinensis]|uniref:uncharacterized protein LOC122310235 n=1 Tax=Carya illinoinensis TaxID=32201 RepID=UPI001C71EE1D|nr:uncharacterized protein LOC122310235 [Carya illinoinensis]